ncbi:catalase family peroxidase [Methylobacterium sp. J-068]|uniref:catalase family peroxidase n=1 Tax=Methylobacterium sp. J-068 TaxID=2836649 RepID=UPI001FB94D93|nr:catalase family peroxidase [Methylobacterium sp. J-068]MCJ2033579.1 catalase family peroxidase [Methylobacterium sp. J-068]
MKVQIVQKQCLSFSQQYSRTRWLSASVAFLMSSTTLFAAEEQASSKTNQTEIAKGIVAAFDAIFAGPHASMRAVHGQGVLCEGTFTAGASAKSVSHAVHFQGTAVPVVVRFSNFSSLPARADGDPSGSPRGMAIKFILPDGEDTDIVAHSYNGFPAGTPEDFLGFLKAVGAKDPQVLAAFLETHPAAKNFVDAPKPTPASFATEAFYGVDAFRFINAAGVEQYGRYRIEPVAGQVHLSASDAAKRAPDFLSQDLAEQLKISPAEFRLLLQLPAPGDPIHDGSVAWAENRAIVEVGTITLRTLTSGPEATDQPLFFTPLNLVSGITSSDDPLLAARTRAYRISFERRSKSVAARNQEGGGR